MLRASGVEGISAMALYKLCFGVWRLLDHLCVV